MNEALVAILNETLQLLRRKGNDFAWSSWEDIGEAEADIQGHIGRIQKGDYSRLFDLRILFAPTGPIQEVSIDSQWGQEFLALAQRFDKEINSVPSTAKNGHDG